MVIQLMIFIGGKNQAYSQCCAMQPHQFFTAQIYIV